MANLINRDNLFLAEDLNPLSPGYEPGTLTADTQTFGEIGISS
jgi:hypothetical protein